MLQWVKVDSVPTDLTVIKRELVDMLFEAFGGEVRVGPFKGMKILKDVAWKDTHLAPLLIGCYEEELHGVFETHIVRLNKFRHPTISVFGCAEGYYAVGLKRRVPNATVYVIDEDPVAGEICKKTAAANDVTIMEGAPLSVTLNTDLIVMDVEGAEIEYLNPVEFPMLRDRHIIVEIHNWKTPDTGEYVGQIVLDRFRASHRVVLMTEGLRNPNQYDFLLALNSDYRWAAMCEGRPHLMCWYVMEPKGQVLS